MFSRSVSGAESSANAYSIIETAKTNGLDPYKYLTTIFTYLPSQDLIKDPEIIDEFLPCEYKRTVKKRVEITDFYSISCKSLQSNTYKFR